MNSLKEEVRKYILSRRTISYSNVCQNFNKEPVELSDIISEMEDAEDIRVINSACTLDCGSCSSSCDDNDQESKTMILPTTIIVSINRLF